MGQEETTGEAIPYYFEGDRPTDFRVQSPMNKPEGSRAAAL